MKRDEILRRLEERLAAGEISEKTYLGIKERYERQPEEPEPSSPAEEVERSAEQFGSSIERMVREIVEPIVKNLETVIPAAVQTTREAVRIAGHGVVTGTPVRARTFKSSGSGVVEGDLEADEVHVAGSCEFKGNVEAREFHASGSADVRGNLQADELHASGSLEVGGHVKSREIVARGAVRIGGNIDGRDVDIRGGVQVGGALTATEVVIEIDGDSSIGSISGQEVTVRRPGGFFRGARQLTTNEITGQEISLESTIANAVRGQEVTIGPHCRIGLVEAQELTVHESSEVRERHMQSV